MRALPTLSAVSIPFLLVSCGTSVESEAPVTTSGCMVSAPAGFNDQSVTQLSYGEMTNARDEGFLGSTSTQRVSTEDGTRAALERYADEDCTLTVLTGPGGAAQLTTVALDNPDEAFMAVATAFDYPDNVVTVEFDLVEPAFIAGYVAAAKSEDGTVAAFTSLGFDNSAALLEAFDAGVEQRNRDVDSEVVSWRSGANDARTVPDTGQAGSEITAEAAEAGADVILPLASGAAEGLRTWIESETSEREAAAKDAEAAEDAGDADGGSTADPGDASADEEEATAEESVEDLPEIIWYGTDGSKTLSTAVRERVVASIVPNVAAGFQTTLVDWPATGDAGEIPETDAEPETLGELQVRQREYVGTIDNEGIGVLASDGLLGAVAGLGRDVEDVEQRISDGEIELP